MKLAKNHKVTMVYTASLGLAKKEIRVVDYSGGEFITYFEGMKRRALKKDLKKTAAFFILDGWNSGIEENRIHTTYDRGFKSIRLTLFNTQEQISAMRDVDAQIKEKCIKVIEGHMLDSMQQTH